MLLAGLLLESFNVTQPSIDTDVKHKSYPTKKFLKLVEACKASEFKEGIESKVLTEKFSKAARLTQKELKESSAAADSSDLKIHLNFFHSCFDFVAGDITSNPLLLEKNVNKILSL